MSHLDDVVPHGNPNAAHCRWCGAHRGKFGAALLCPNCDVVHAIVQ